MLPIRELFAATLEARRRGYKKSRFSFNVANTKGGGRCEDCGGAGVKTIEMQFLNDVYVECDACAGQRFGQETLDVRYLGKTIAEVLDLSVAEAAEMFSNHRKISRILETLLSVGLGYIKLGQPSTTLSGGEAQRIKLASELQRPSKGHTLYVLDEPSTGLHMKDVGLLIDALQRLIERGHSVLVVEHDVDIIKIADHRIDLGPDGGEAGGQLIGAGTPEELALQDSPTGRVLKQALTGDHQNPAATCFPDP